ncbi:MAG: hypothetical protein P4L92_12910 [Rudaea sp.]|nr:hypothetical protein [Rudaea sp.]
MPGMTAQTGTMAITMAGFGRRFAEAGHTRPKYELTALDRPLFDWSMAGIRGFLDAGWGLRLAARSGEGARAFISARAVAMSLQVDAILELDRPTDGQATTALFLARTAPPDLPFAVFNIDTFVAPGALVPDQIPGDCDGWVPCFEAPGNGWSFARVDDKDRILELREKQRISPHATIGFYWFRSAALYCELYDRFFADAGGMEKGERYIAPMYNSLIAAGSKVAMARVPFDSVGALGTPDQVDAFQRNAPRAAIKMAGIHRSPPATDASACTGGIG